ncbi:MAG: VanZ family protein [Deltaproteobacteria bacterium]|nr:VanZ family protein [Deltaproteobacteria bacterium]MBW1719388.1 VanZ family protein [Deltaproteobacteria bacterium]MBW1933659.1 VanZ family protein [Deltaproteobacteria bacterium]MBW1938226.1 VanZ family protein [Deltaproteobacteria bacterium]MBW1965508.1 VanZ family protein [Deltaproteobacteria bacterium]
MNIRLALCIAYAGVIFGISSVPGSRLPSISVNDYFIHFLEYVALGSLLMWWRLHNSALSIAGAMCQAIFLGSLYGLADEFHQYFVPNRHADPVDWVADTLGSVVGAIAVLALFLVFSKRSASQEGMGD